MTADQLRTRLYDALADGSLDLPLPGGGRSAERLHALARIAATDLALARVAEAHVDAVAILQEAGTPERDGCTYGVWASEAPTLVTTLSPYNSAFELSGSKGFCTGAGIVDRALVTARLDDTVRLVDVAVDETNPLVDFELATWTSPAFADTNTATARFRPQLVDQTHVVGGANWYLERPGFWHGALSPAACWAGGAIGLVDHCISRAGPSMSAHRAAHVGVLDSCRWQLMALLTAAGDELDVVATAATDGAQLAHRYRAAVEQLATTVIEHAVRGFGPRLLAGDAWASQRVAELQLYIRQHQDSADHDVLGRLAVEGVKIRP